MNSAMAFFVGPEPVPALASGLPVICADGCGITDSDLVSFPEAGRSSQALMDWAPAQQLLAGRAGGVAVWKSSVATERLAAQLGLTLANSPAKVARRLENKAYFSAAAARAGLPVPRMVAGPAGPELRAPALELGPPLVFQLAHGFSGAATYPVTSELDLDQLLLRFAGQTCRIAEVVPGTAVTVTGVAFPDQIVAGPACLQLTGIRVLTPHPMGSCGNDFQAVVPHRSVVEGIAAQVGEWLREQGHRGVFGVDLVVAEDGRCWCIEVNPRLVASVPLWSLSARDLGEPSLLEQHLACFGLGQQSAGQLHCHWSQLIIYRGGDARGPETGPGAAETARGRLSPDGGFAASGPLTLDGPAAGEAALIVRAGARPGHELARLITDRPLTSAQGELRPEWMALVSRVRSRLD
ncbi:MAG: ATP-grasp domain-containing protein [Candidatus Dormibacteraeota bacterium]|nr:ATP-grasp domain-containing protein [Candidatus Dormibacteraeota bacterium]